MIGLVMAAPAAALEVRPGALVEIGGAELVIADIVVPRAVQLDHEPDWQLEPPSRLDRWGRPVVRLVDGDRSIAARLVAAGDALVSPDATGPDLAELLRLEAAAREARLGLWRRTFTVQDAADVRGPIGALVLVEDVVHAVGWGGDRLYINFAEDIRNDFTGRVSRADVRALARIGIDLAALQGHRVRLRGWLRYAGGPMIDIQGPAQIEVLR